MNIPRWGFSYDGWVDVQNLLQLSSELRTHLGRVALDQEVHQQQGQEGHSTDFFKTKNPFHSKSLRSTSNTSNTFHCTRGHSGNKIWQFYICQLSNFYTVGIAVHAIDLLQKIILIFHLQLVICCCWCNYIHIWEWVVVGSSLLQSSCKIVYALKALLWTNKFFLVKPFFVQPFTACWYNSMKPKWNFIQSSEMR